MDIVVHGTKGGRQIFTPKKLGGLLDVNSDASKSSAIGQEAFAIRFVENTIIFSKYKIIRDVRGDKRTGFLAFSLFLPSNKKLHGKDIISILNKVSGEYYRRYIPDNDNNLKDVREDWTFLERISDEYKTNKVSSEDIENLLSGTKDDAFIYYENDPKLQKYFDAPYQDEYSQYRQVLFVKEDLKNKPEDPLNALRHSSEDNLSGKIDLENPKYKLIFKQTTNEGVRINVEVNSVTRQSNSRIRRKDELEISWSKQFCETVKKRGKWTEISNEFIDVNNSTATVSINEIVPPDKTKTITFDIKDKNGTTINYSEITCKRDSDSRNVINNMMTFRGQEIGLPWYISAKNGDELFSEIKKIIPDKENRVELVLNKRKTIKFQGEYKTYSGSEYYTNIKISIRKKNIYKSSNTEVEFINDEIDDQFEVVTNYSENNKIFYGNKIFSPKDFGGGKPVSVELEQQTFQQTSPIYPVNPGKHGTLIAQYDKSKYFYKRIIIIACIFVLAVVLGFIIWEQTSLFEKAQRLQVVSSRSSDQMPDSISVVSNPAKPKVENTLEEAKGGKTEKTMESPKVESLTAKTESKKEKNSGSPPVNTDNTNGINNKLQSNIVTKQELQNWKDKGMNKNPKSIDLYLNFWKIVNSDQIVEFKELQKSVNSDAILKKSELNNFLKNICLNQDSFQKYKSVAGKATCNTIAELKDKMNENN